MWVFANNAFVSIVQHRDKPSQLIVRGRFPGDVEAFLAPWPGEAEETPAADYRFRAVVSRRVVQEALRLRARDIDYPNFKDSVVEAGRHTAYLNVWTVMFRAQQDLLDAEFFEQPDEVWTQDWILGGDAEDVLEDPYSL